MNFEMSDFLSAMPEIFVLTMACAILLADLFIPKRAKVITYILAQATLVGAALLTLSQYGIDSPMVTLGGMFVLDNLADRKSVV